MPRFIASVQSVLPNSTITSNNIVLFVHLSCKMTTGIEETQ